MGVRVSLLIREGSNVHVQVSKRMESSPKRHGYYKRQAQTKSQLSIYLFTHQKELAVTFTVTLMKFTKLHQKHTITISPFPHHQFVGLKIPTFLSVASGNKFQSFTHFSLKLKTLSHFYIKSSPNLYSHFDPKFKTPTRDHARFSFRQNSTGRSASSNHRSGAPTGAPNDSSSAPQASLPLSLIPIEGHPKPDPITKQETTPGFHRRVPRQPRSRPVSFKTRS